MKKLYEVKVNFTYYAMADTPVDAQLEFGEACSNENSTAVTRPEEVSLATRLDPQWSGDCVVYGMKKDTTLDAALKIMGLPKVEEMRKTQESKKLTLRDLNPGDRFLYREEGHVIHTIGEAVCVEFSPDKKMAKIRILLNCLKEVWLNEFKTDKLEIIERLTR